LSEYAHVCSESRACRWSTYLTEAHHGIKRPLLIDDLLDVLMCRSDKVGGRDGVKGIVRPREDFIATLRRGIVVLRIKELILKMLGKERPEDFCPPVSILEVQVDGGGVEIWLLPV
jgi:hypothetical protein